MPARKKPLPVLGELESTILEHLWECDECGVLDAHVAIGKSRGITANTIGSAIERLHRKGLLKRRKVSHAYRYSAALTRDAFAAWRVLDAVGNVKTLADTGLLAAFVDLVADVDDEALDRLDALIAEKRLKRDDG